MALNEAKEKVCQLESAIKKLDMIKKHLSHNASDIKGEIHSCVSHNLECLRGREVSLLGKVDEVVGQKEEALQQQQAQFNQALGVLRTRMALATTDSALDKQMADILTKFGNIELSPGETPHIGFRADHMSLKECIQNYGRVDANALALPSAFDGSGKLSASLPRHLEEYDDVDHHIFHKTVKELKESKSITVSIPKLSTRMEDWLQKRLTYDDNICHAPSRPTALQTCCTPTSSMKNSVQPGASNTPGDTCSLNNWLSQIKSHVDLEEEHDFEIIDNSRNGKDKSKRSSGNNDELKQWLHNAPGYRESLCSGQQLPNYFQHIPSDSKMWLRQPCTQLEEVKPRDFFSHISKEPATWLRSRAYGKLLTQQVASDKGKEKLVFKDKNMDHWLAPSSKPKKQRMENRNNNNCCQQAPWQQKAGDVTSKLEKTKPMTFQLEDICKANELCSSLSDCVSSPNCAVLRQKEISVVKNAPNDPIKLVNPMQLPMSHWLSPSEDLIDFDKMEDSCELGTIDDEKKDMACVDDKGKDKGISSHCGNLTMDDWLFKPVSGLLKTSPAPTTTCSNSNPAFKHSKEEMNRWLQQGEETLSEEDVKPNLSFNNTHLKSSLSQWLLNPVQQEAQSKEDGVMKEDSEGWSLCSTPTSFNSDQFSKDVEVATSYLQNWVI